MKLKDAMHKGVDWGSPETPVAELAKLMRDHDVGAIRIGENHRLVGMVIRLQGIGAGRLRCQPRRCTRCNDSRNPLLP